MKEQQPPESDVIGSPPPPLEPVAALQLVNREQLRISLKPQMSKETFTNWLYRAMKDAGFPEPVRTGRRSCEWWVPEVRKWLGSRPRKGMFSGRRRGGTSHPPSSEAT